MFESVTISFNGQLRATSLTIHDIRVTYENMPILFYNFKNYAFYPLFFSYYTQILILKNSSDDPTFENKISKTSLAV